MKNGEPSEFHYLYFFSPHSYDQNSSLTGMGVADITLLSGFEVEVEDLERVCSLYFLFKYQRLLYCIVHFVVSSTNALYSLKGCQNLKCHICSELHTAVQTSWVELTKLVPGK